MSESPLTPPVALGPFDAHRPDPPTVAMSGVMSSLTDASQQLIDHIYACINQAATSLSSAENDIRQGIIDCINAVEYDYIHAGGAIESAIMTKIGFILSQVASLPLEQVTEEEIRQRASAVPWQLGPLPPAPSVPPVFYPVNPPRVIEQPVAGRSIGDLTPGPVPTLLSEFAHGSPLPPAPAQPYAPFGSSPQQPVAQQGGPGGPYGNVQPVPTPTGPGQPFTPWTLPGGPPDNILHSTPDPSGGAGAPPASNWQTPAAGAPPAGPSGAPAAGNAAPIGAGQGGPCPPVNVVIQCAPGVTAQQLLPGEQVEVGQRQELQGGQQFIEFGEAARGAGRGIPAPQKLPDREEPPAGTVGDIGITEAAKRMPFDPTKLPPTPSPWDQLLGKDVAGVLARVGSLVGCMGVDELDRLTRSAVGVSAASWWAVTPEGKPDQNTIFGAIVAALPSWLQPAATVVAAVTVANIAGGFRLAQTVSGCDSPLFPVVAGARSLLGFIQTWVGAPFPEAQNRLDQFAGAICPTGIPTAAEAHGMRGRDLITHDQWNCLVRENGLLPDWQEQVFRAGTAWVTPDQAISYWLRTSEDVGVLRQLMNAAGMYETGEIVKLMKLAEYVPGPSDLIRFLVRDVFDPSVVEKYGFDEEFTSKWQGQALEWGRAQGLDTQTAKYYWRAHWQLPSPTQGFTMIHRLRPGAVPDAVVTTQDDIAKLLEIDDYPPFWRDRLIAVSYHPLTRIDIRRSFFIGTLTAEETVSAIMDLGYTEANAQKLLKFWTAERINWLSNQPLAKAYVRGELSDDELLEWLRGMDLPPETFALLMGRLNTLSQAQLRKTALRTIRQRVIHGLTEWTDAVTELEQLGYSGGRSNRLAQAWEQERKARGKYLNAGQLCKMYSNGLINAVEYSTSLLRLGYDSADVQRIMALGCPPGKGYAGQIPLPGQADAQLPQPPGTTLKVKEANRVKAALGRAARERLKLGKAEESVQKRLTQSKTALVKAFGGQLVDYNKPVEDMFLALTGDKCYTRDGASNLVKELVTGMAARRRRDWEGIIDDYIEQLPARPCPAPDNGGNPAKGEELAVPEG